MRLFYAIGLWGLLDLSQLQRGFERVPQLRWVNSDLVHITLNFLGEVDSGACQDAVVSMAEVASNHAPFTLEWNSAGVFPEGRPPRVFWIGLGQRSAECVSKMSLDLGNDRPSPHVTVARVKGVLPTEFVKQWTCVECTWPDVHVTQIQLVESKLTPRGPIYSVIESERLGS